MYLHCEALFPLFALLLSSALLYRMEGSWVEIARLPRTGFLFWNLFFSSFLSLTAEIEGFFLIPSFETKEFFLFFFRWQKSMTQ
jgi:hypothetical protein